MKQNQIIVAIVVALAVGAAGFFAGMKYQDTKINSSNQQFPAQRSGNRQGGQGRFAAGSRPVIGEIIAADDKSITVKMQDGSSKIVLLSGTVTVTKTDAGSKSDLKTGIRVGVFGTDNPDGSVTAQNIQLNPMFRGMMASPSASPR